MGRAPVSERGSEFLNAGPSPVPHASHHWLAFAGTRLARSRLLDVSHRSRWPQLPSRPLCSFRGQLRSDELVAKKGLLFALAIERPLLMRCSVALMKFRR